VSDLLGRPRYFRNVAFEKYTDRTVGWLELFYELVYVATLIQIGNSLSDNLTLLGCDRRRRRCRPPDDLSDGDAVHGPSRSDPGAPRDLRHLTGSISSPARPPTGRLRGRRTPAHAPNIVVELIDMHHMGPLASYGSGGAR
jgi:hypothetical protein